MLVWNAVLTLKPQPTGSDADSLPDVRYGMSSAVSSHSRSVLKIGTAMVAEVDTKFGIVGRRAERLALALD